MSALDTTKENYALTKYLPVGDGLYRQVRVQIAAIPLARASYERQGFPTALQMSYGRFSALAYGGLLEVVEITPKVRQVPIESLIKHMQATADPTFWTPERTAAYKSGLQYKVREKAAS